MGRRVLHILSQRPSRTGSGITLDSLVRLAEGDAWHQAAVVGVPAGDDRFRVGELPPERIFPVRFADDSGQAADLDFPVPGMSDVMPYPSRVWSTLDEGELASYRDHWRAHLARVLGAFQPELIHSNHIWLVSSLIKDLAPDLPVFTTCHATGLRQLELCPHLANEVIAGVRRNDHFFALRHDHAARLASVLGLPGDRITVCGVGFRDEVFGPADRAEEGRDQNLLYVGKFSNAKGLPWLLDAFEALGKTHPGLRLHIAGDGSGPEAETLRRRMADLAPAVTMHGMLDQEQLARLMGRCGVAVLPSFYEGVPLVLVEAAACGCRLVATDLPGVQEAIAPVLGDHLVLVPTPRLHRVDEPLSEDLPAFVAALTTALAQALDHPPGPGVDLSAFTWRAVFQRIEGIWRRF